MEMIFPRAFAFAVDDMGWMEGSNLYVHGGQGPSRLGIKRRMGLDDYKVLVETGKAAGVRIQGLFVLAEFDQTNECARYPTTTMAGSEWKNNSFSGSEQNEIMQYVQEQSAYLEFGLHGVGHEFWPEKGHRVRAEWYDIEHHRPWPETELYRHLECFRNIMAQYGLTKENGHSFPRSFVPCAYSYWWNPHGTYSLGKILGEVGVKYANTCFDEIRELNPPAGDNGGGFDHGVHVINRINYGNEWFSLASLPNVPLAEQHSDIIESHWANWLAQDQFLQPEVTSRFIEYYRQVQLCRDRYVAKNTEQLHSQWLYQKYTVVTQSVPGEIRIDNRAMPAEAYAAGLPGNLVLKLPLEPGLHVSSAQLDSMQIPSCIEDAGAGFLYLPPLDRAVYTLNYTVSSSELPLSVSNAGTCSVYSVVRDNGNTGFDLTVYGTQTLSIRCPKPESVCSCSAGITVVSSQYDEHAGILELVLHARDFQGERGRILLH
jgi:hypothetical protein